MAVRFSRSGTNKIQDHKDLLNIGNRTHDEIDTYLDEIDHARGSSSSLGARIASIETKNALQDNKLQALEKSDTEQDEQISGLIDDVTAIDKEQDEHSKRLDTLESLIGSGGGEINLSEVTEARTDNKGVTFESLKARLDYMQSKLESGVTTTSGGFLFQVFQVKNSTDEVVVNTNYAVGQNEIEVFRGGVRQITGTDYLEVSSNMIKFTEVLYPNEMVIIRKRSRSGLSGVELTSDHVITTDKATKYTLSEQFNSPYRKLELFYNGLLMANDIDFTVAGNEVTLNFVPVVGSLLIFQKVEEKDLSKKFILEEHQKIVVGKQQYQIASFTFLPNQLEVYVSGVKQLAGKDYVEIGINRVLFNEPLPDQGVISFVKENTSAIATVGNSNATTYKQKTLTEITASSNMPYAVDIPIDVNPTFNHAPVEVLKYKPGQLNVTQTHSLFNEVDSSSYTPSPYIVFDGALKLKTKYTEKFTDLGTYGLDGGLSKVTIKKHYNEKIYDIDVQPSSLNPLSLIYHNNVYKTVPRSSVTAKKFSGSSVARLTVSHTYTNVTLEAWVRPDRLSGTQTIVTNIDTGGYGLTLSGNKAVAMVYIGGAYRSSASTTVLEVGKWYHLAMTYNGSTKKIQIYVNGKLESSATYSGSFSNSGMVMAIGSNPNSGGVYQDYFSGGISDVRVWNVIRTEQQIRDNWAELNLAEQTSANLVAWYKLDEASGTACIDSSTYKRNATYKSVTNTERIKYSRELITVSSNLPTLEQFNEYGISNISLALHRANDSTPLDLIKNDFEIVTYMDNSATQVEKVVQITKIPQPQLVLATNDISIKHIDSFESIYLDYVNETNSYLKVIVSFDGGGTWNTFNGNSFIEIEPVASDVAQHGIEAKDLSNISKDNWSLVRGNSNTIRFGYYLASTELSVLPSVSKLSSLNNTRGKWQSAIKGTQYNYEYPDTQTLLVNLYENGDYKVNYGG